MSNVQIIATPKGEKLAVLPLNEYEQLRILADQNAEMDEEDEFDRQLERKALKTLERIKSGEEETIPGEVVFAEILDKVHPVRAWREYKGWTAAKLAKKAGINRVYLTQIENKKRKGPVKVYKALAKALGCSVDSLVK